MPTTAFDAFRAELGTLKELLKRIDTRTLRDELLLERFRTLYVGSNDSRRIAVTNPRQEGVPQVKRRVGIDSETYVKI